MRALHVVDGHTFEPPRTRGDCLDGGSNAGRPCPWVRCKHHLALDVDPRSGQLVEHAAPEDMPVSCALDAAETGAGDYIANVSAHGAELANGLEVIGGLLGVSRERIRQIEAEALDEMRLHYRRADR